MAGKQIVFHTDSAKSYRLKIDGVVHDRVVHKKVQTKARGKTVWLKPRYVELKKHRLPGGKMLAVKSGTQVQLIFLELRLRSALLTRASALPRFSRVRARRPRNTSRAAHGALQCHLPLARLRVLRSRQVIDRAWRFIKDKLGACRARPGSRELTYKIRSAQWCYWHRCDDLWEATGRMLQRAFTS